MAASRATGVKWGFALAVALAAGLGLLVSLAAPASAEAVMKYEGGTGQGKPIKLRTSNRGIIRRVRVGGRVRCWNGVRAAGHSTFTPPFKRANPKRFRDMDRVVTREGGARFVSRDWISGRFVNPNQRRIKGRYRVVINVYRGGREINRCTLRTRWRAGIVN